MYAVEPSAIHLSVLPNLCCDSESDLRDISVPLENWLDKPNYELPDLTSHFVVEDKLGGTRPRSDPVLILPIFLDTGDPETVLPVPELRHPIQVLDFACGIELGRGPYFSTPEPADLCCVPKRGLGTGRRCAAVRLAPAGAGFSSGFDPVDQPVSNVYYGLSRPSRISVLWRECT